MNRWQRFKRAARIRWQGECAEDGCEKATRAQYMPYADYCDEHGDERWRKRLAEIRAKEREDEIEKQAEALRRTLPDALRQAREETA